MEDGTKEEYVRVFELLKKFELGLADRVLSALQLCAKYDQMAFDPDYDTMPLDALEPMVRCLFAREPWGAHAKEQSGYAERF